MRWQQGRRSSNVEDRRGQSPRRGRAALGGGGALIVIIIAVVMALMGKDPSSLLEAVAEGGGASAPAGSVQPNPGEDQLADFVSVVLADTEDTWTQILSQRGVQYQPPRLILFRDAVQSRCGYNTAAVGPFYCPPDRQVYIDLSFFEQLDRQFGAPGDFAQAYVVAHEVGHHMQTLLGISQRLRQQKRTATEIQANLMSVQQELQADCFAGVWANHAQRRNLLEPGDLEEGLRAAASIGDDTLQRRAGGRVQPETWTHGSSEQRVRWFRTGFQTGAMEQCNTYQSTRL